MLGVNDRHDAVEAVKARDRIVHKECLAHRAGISDPRCFNHNVIKVNFALVAADSQIRENPGEVSADRAADAAVIHLNDLLLAVMHEKLVIDPLFTEFIFDDGDLVLVILTQNPV